MKIIHCQQRTPEWYSSRIGIPSASNFDSIVTMDGKPSKQRDKYLYRLAGESIAGISEETFTSAAMLRGIELEDEARRLYEVVSDEQIIQVGFCVSDCGRYGASPDGLVGDDGLIEIKCPNMATHVSYLLQNKLPSDYFQQVQGQLLVTGREWCDFVSYYPGIKPFIFRVFPDKDFIKLLEKELDKFCKELIEIAERIA